ncbi:GNAT family N-acetyltransferase [Treponema sp. OMZ 799]|uniref:GNAT family N-acetyltransferase n=1 Tax=Treponema sp. OMZ 799 TaxID=2563668 RepID=UPI0020A42122|nr:GNAT family N-acetyltransferase [Treponema sp. OMZ 799]UTC76964.1 GNAT family N-acetyltransferase [Treponema sp. OMZ 799]
MIEIKEIAENKKQFLSLLLLADEQEDMIDKYIEDGTMYILEDNGIKAECVVIDAGDKVLEIKNIAVLPDCQGKGYGKALIDFIIRKYKGKYSVLQAGTGESPMTIPFYEKCGFIRSHTVKNFFIDHYNHPIYENGIQLVDMVYLKRNL